jgi:hypothetical protein
MVETESIFGAEGLRACVGDLVDARILDGLSEHDANTVSMLVCLDFTKGPEHMAWRVTDWLNPDGNSVGREDENTWAVAAVLASAFIHVVGAFAGPEFEKARDGKYSVRARFGPSSSWVTGRPLVTG